MSEEKTSTEQKKKKKNGCLKWLLVFFGLAGITVLVVVFVCWWIGFRPIKPVELSVKEEKVLQEKVEVIQKPSYEKGKKEIILSEREINGLINKHTKLGDRVKLELADDAIHLLAKVDVPKESPIMGGSTVNIKARAQVKVEKGDPRFILEDVTCMGISMPNDWLGDIKNINLLDHVGTDTDKGAILNGMKSLEVKSGEIVIQLKD